MKGHLLPRVLSTLCSEDSNRTPEDCDPNWVLFKADRLYRHNLLRINYTTYDVRRSQDVINALTPHCNIMILNNDSDTHIDHPYRYARVLGIYHVNVIYLGPGTQGYKSHRMEFLWYDGTKILAQCTMDGMIHWIELSSGRWPADENIWLP